MLTLLQGVGAFGPRLALQGGAALLFAYGSPRLTRDLDFAARPEVFPDPAELMERIPGLELRRDDRQAVPPFLRLVRTERRHGFALAVPVEVAGVPAEDVRTVDLGGGPVWVEAPDEILTDKVVACLVRMRRRGTVKPQDLFDIAYLRYAFPGVRTSAERVARRLAAYGEAAEARPVVGRLLEWLRGPGAVPAVRDGLEAVGTVGLPDGGPGVEQTLPPELRFERVPAAVLEVLQEVFGG